MKHMIIKHLWVKFDGTFLSVILGYVFLTNWLDTLYFPDFETLKLIINLLISLFTLGFVAYRFYRELKLALKDKILTEEEFQKLVEEFKLTAEQAQALWLILKKISKK